MDAFSDDTIIQNGINQTIGSIPALQPLFTSIGTYVSNLKAENNELKRRLDSTNGGNTDQLSKKRKIDDSAAQPNAPSLAPSNTQQTPRITSLTSGTGWISAPAEYIFGDISVSAPIRKKLRLELMSGTNGGLRAVNQSTGNTEIGIAWRDLDKAIQLLVPEKAQTSYNFILIPYMIQPASIPIESDPETLILTIPNTPLKSAKIPLSGNLHPDPESKLPDFFSKVLGICLTPLNKKVTLPNLAEFTSTLSEAHRKGEKNAHVKAFRGSKDGYLYFLNSGILFGFRKPILYFPFASIESVSYSSVLQRTFNLTIAARGVDTSPHPSSDKAGVLDELQEFEFSMLDQADYTGIDEYVKRHGLNDASLAESRRAKKFDINKGRGSGGGDVNGSQNGVGGAGQIGGTGAEDDDEEMTEIQKAEMALQDAEDEEEEDYDPGSEGESEGSGSESEDGGDGGGDAQGDADGDDEDADEVEGEFYEEDD